MADVVVDLSAERELALELAQHTLESQVGPHVQDELRARWPRRTGRSADAWTYVPSLLTNSVDYTEDVRVQGRTLALDSVLQPIVTEAQQRRWME